MSILNKTKAVFLSACVSAAFAVPAFAAGEASGPDFSSLTNSISFTTVIAGIMTIAAGVMGLRLAIVGARKIIAFVRA